MRLWALFQPLPSRPGLSPVSVKSANQTRGVELHTFSLVRNTGKHKVVPADQPWGISDSHRKT